MAMNARKPLFQLLATAMLASSLPASAATVYLCRAYAGGDFFSNTACERQQAATISRHTVPDSMPFNQQTAIVKSRIERSDGAAQRETAATNKRRECEFIEQQQLRLIKKYESGNYVPVPEVNADQIQHRKLRSQATQLGC